MADHSINWAATFTWLTAVSSIYVGFALSAKLAKSGQRLLAATVPMWLFAPVTLLLQLWGGGASSVTTWPIFGFAVVLSFVTWGGMREARGC